MRETMNLEARTLQGQRVTLRKLDESAIPDMYEYGSMPEFYKNLDARPFEKYNDAVNYFNRLMDLVAKGSLYWSIEYNEHKKVIGTGGVRNINIEERKGECTLGISPLYHKYGLAVETFFLIHDFCFNVIGLDEIYGIVSSQNHSSIKMLDRLGYIRIDTLPNYFKKLDGTPYDAYHHIITPTLFNNNIELKEFIKNKI